MPPHAPFQETPVETVNVGLPRAVRKVLGIDEHRKAPQDLASAMWLCTSYPRAVNRPSLLEPEKDKAVRRARGVKEKMGVASVTGMPGHTKHTAKAIVPIWLRALPLPVAGSKCFMHTGKYGNS